MILSCETRLDTGVLCFKNFVNFLSFYFCTVTIINLRDNLFTTSCLLTWTRKTSIWPQPVHTLQAWILSFWWIRSAVWELHQVPKRCYHFEEWFNHQGWMQNTLVKEFVLWLFSTKLLTVACCFINLANILK